MKKIETTNQFNRQLRKCLKRGYDENKLIEVLKYLERGEALPLKYKAHKLTSKYNYCWECHIQPDWLLLWEEDEDNLRLLLIQTGSHSDIF